ncbi:MAG: hypothetical protein NVSMB49_01510 [Ktedonobacteraceae bacterium]
MSQPLGTGVSQPLSTTSAHLAAVRLKSANKQIFRALLSLASANLLIRIVGMLNQVVVAARFGQGAQMDAYFIASGLPVLLAQLLASALEASVIPVYASLRGKGKKEQASRLFSTLLNLLLISMVIVTIGMFVLHNQLVSLSGPGLKHDSLVLADSLTPYIFPVLIFMVLNSFMECLLNTEGQFGWPAYAGILVPLTTAMLVVLAGKSHGVFVLCIGTLLGQVLQLIVIILRARKAKFVYRPILDLHSPEIAAIGIVAWPALFSGLISQASPFVDQIFASTLSVGSIAVLNNALKLISVPIGVILSSVGRAALPYLARQAAIKDMRAFKETLRLYLWAVGISTLVVTAGMIIFAHLTVEIIFEHGAFTEEDTSRTAITLIGFTIGLTPMAFGFITSRAFSALGNTRVLLYVTIFSIIANAIFDYIFGKIWQSFGIALSTSAVYACTMFILLFTLRRSIGKLYLFTPPREVLNIVWRLGLGQYYMDWLNWKNQNLDGMRLPYNLQKKVIRASIICIVFIAGITTTVINSLYALRIAFGSLVVLALLRYKYALLIVWVAIDALIGSTLAFFSGNNFLSGLTVPTLLLMFVMPVKASFKRMPILPFLFAYLLWVFASIGISAIGVGQFLTYWLVYLDYVAVGVLVINLLTTRKKLMGLIDAILILSLFISFYGIYGFFTKQNGLYDTNIASLYRIGSVFGAPPTLAFFLSTIIPLALYRTITLEGWKRIIGIFYSLIFLAALGLTFTRGALISVPLSIIVMIFFLPSRKLKVSMISGIAVIAAVTVFIALFSGLPIFSRFLNGDITTLNGRTYLWQALLDHFDPTQLLGQGLSASDILLTNLQVGAGRGVIGTAPHNIFIGTLYDHGIIGVTLLTFVLITIPVTLIRRMRGTTPEHRLILATALAAFISIFIQSLEVTVVWNQQVGVYVWMILSLPFALYWNSARKSTEEEGKTEVTAMQETAQEVEEEQLVHA